MPHNAIVCRPKSQPCTNPITQQASFEVLIYIHCLSYIRKLPLDSLKIDQTFVRQITSIPRDTSIVNAIIGMGRSLKLQVIAEGVETKEELDFLKLQECDEAQGFYFSQPVPANQFANLLVSHPLDPSGLLSSI